MDRSPSAALKDHLIREFRLCAAVGRSGAGSPGKYYSQPSSPNLLISVVNVRSLTASILYSHFSPLKVFHDMILTTPTRRMTIKTSLNRR